MDSSTRRRFGSTRAEFPGVQPGREPGAAWKPRSHGPAAPQEIDGAIAVDDRHIVAVRAGRSGLRVECLAGHVWVTQEGADDDMILAAGQTFRTDSAGKVVVQAYDPALIRVTRT